MSLLSQVELVENSILVEGQTHFEHKWFDAETWAVESVGDASMPLMPVGCEEAMFKQIEPTQADG